MSKAQCHHRGAAERFIENCYNFMIKSNSYIDRRSSTLEEFLKEQATDSKCQATAQKGRHHASCYSYDSNRISMGTEPVDGALQNLVPDTYVPTAYACLPTTHLQDSPGKEVCTTRCENTLTVRPWHMICTHVYKNVGHAPKIDLK